MLKYNVDRWYNSHFSDYLLNLYIVILLCYQTLNYYKGCELSLYLQIEFCGSSSLLPVVGICGDLIKTMALGGGVCNAIVVKSPPIPHMGAVGLDIDRRIKG